MIQFTLTSIYEYIASVLENESEMRVVIKMDLKKIVRMESVLRFRKMYRNLPLMIIVQLSKMR